MNTFVINFLGGPGAGKSTMAARVFAILKEKGHSVELATEYAKDMVWQESNHVLNNQVYIFGKQHNRIWRLYNKVKFIVTDAPLINSVIYGDTTDEFKAFVRAEIFKFNHINFYLDRNFSYDPQGRMQTEDEAEAIDDMVINELERSNASYFRVLNDEKATDHIYKLIMDWVENDDDIFEHL